MEEQKKGYGRLLWVLIVAILLLALLLGAVMLLLVRDRGPDRKEGLAYEANVVAGDIPGKSKEERQRELDSIVEEGMLAMSINATPSGKGTGKDRSVNWLIENPGNQGKLIRVEVYRDDTGEKIYETGAIKPGSYVESAPPDVNLPVGEYDCTARFYTYRLETEEYIGQAAAKIKLVIYE
ncbi:MAG: hypothetical protein KH024_00370 [Hungatella hathewayi]|nr:hypothetical protein [Hungatella hathewayi]